MLVEKIKILVIDDNQDIIDMLKFVSKKYDIMLEFSINGREALNRKDIMEFRTILVDLAMPVMNGEEFIKEYKKLGGKAKLIIQSSYVVKDLMGADNYIKKPYSITNLIKLIYQK